MKSSRYFPWSLALALTAAPVMAPMTKVEAQQASAPSVTVQKRAPDLTYAANEVLKMVDSGIEDNVIESFIQGYEVAFNLSADDILYLDERGVPPELISSMLRHDASLSGQTSDSPAAPTPSPEQPAQPSPPPSSSTQPANPSSSSEYIANPPPEVATFYQSLAPYGSWIYLNGRGWCWQPSVASINSNWQPYVDDGRWCYTDDGWYWDSRYAWGWAPFHYGRWWNAPCGWVWFPDTVWAPSWVGWRYSGSYCGWAPLPPDRFPAFGLGFNHFGFGLDVGLGFNSFFFVGFGNLFDHDLRFHRFHASHEFFEHAHLAHGFRQRGDLVQNFGIPVDHVSRFAGRSVPVVSVSQRTVDPRAVRPGILNDGRRATVFRPTLPAAPRSTSGMVAREIRGNQRVFSRGTPVPAFLGVAGASTPSGLSGSTRTFNSPALTAPRSSPGLRTAPATRSFTGPRSTIGPGIAPRASSIPSPAFMRNSPTVAAPTLQSAPTRSIPTLNAPTMHAAPAPSFHTSAPAVHGGGGGGHAGGHAGNGGGGGFHR